MGEARPSDDGKEESGGYTERIAVDLILCQVAQEEMSVKRDIKECIGVSEKQLPM
jgi:hypothetical protein